MANNTLDHLLEIEASAAAMVNSAQEEADKRVRENEEKNRITFEERYKSEIQTREESLVKKRIKIEEQYQKALDDYRREVFSIIVDEEKFSVLFNRYLESGYPGSYER